MARTGADRAEISVDISGALTTIHQLGKDLNRERFMKCMDVAIRDTGRRGVKAIVKRLIPQDYEVTPSWVGKKVGQVDYTRGVGGMAATCVVHIKGERGTLGGIFPASGGGIAAGRAKKNGKDLKRLKRKKKGMVRADILKGKTSDIPDSLKNQGGNPPFRYKNGVVMTRTTDKKKPIARVVGRAVPQMVDKQFEARIVGPLGDYAVTRFKQAMKRW